MEIEMLLALSMGLFALLALAVVFVPLGIALHAHRNAQRHWIRSAAIASARDELRPEREFAQSTQ
jgi:ABC-type microcin C transport system permease subunit YejB